MADSPRGVIDELEGQILTTDRRFQHQLMRLGLAALSSRALVWAVVLGGASLWGYAVLKPEPLRLVGAALYCLSLVLPVLWRDTKGG